MYHSYPTYNTTITAEIYITNNLFALYNIFVVLLMYIPNLIAG